MGCWAGKAGLSLLSLWSSMKFSVPRGVWVPQSQVLPMFPVPLWHNKGFR